MTRRPGLHNILEIGILINSRSPRGSLFYKLAYSLVGMDEGDANFGEHLLVLNRSSRDIDEFILGLGLGGYFLKDSA